ncbi:benzoate/H(+) symporter BenE family transporter [Rudaeicoccus suwonensis]|uniref:Benzoate membrane transport protein n=1 Tax=Rudaeicoccus suwonensis TaxID=657409 RepID=A0A561E6L9_9MICO|nr:benzoate/H(+) symporter BenE family transporter [Rudaeicoccus suwonensis]TWE11263.1 benzoate membrane transport protein [Rudaeicoccus suwonensis]
MTVTAAATPTTVPVTAGVACALVGFTSSFAVVLTGLRSVGATPLQAASGLLAVTVLQGVGMVALAWRFRIPITLAWSTPGAALLVSAGVVTGGWPAAVGAFVVTGLLILVTGVWSGLADLIRRIPTTIAQAMLAGVLLPICLEPVRAMAHNPEAVLPILLCWLIFQRFAARWAVPAAFVVAACVIAVSLVHEHRHIATAELLPRLDPTMPHITWQAMIGIALPLYIVTMASQNIPGVAVMKSFDYAVPWRPAMTVTGVGTVVGAAAGGHAINLAAISAALAAGPHAGADRDRRWIASCSAGVTYLVLGAASAALATLIALAPSGVAETVAGIALLTTLAGALHSALGGTGRGDERASYERIAAIVTFAVAASDITVAGVGSAFWALVIGLLVRGWLLSAE